MAEKSLLWLQQDKMKVNDIERITITDYSERKLKSLDDLNKTIH